MSQGFFGLFSRQKHDKLSKNEGGEGSRQSVTRVDRYGFPITLRPKDITDRERCLLKEEARAKSWRPYERARRLPRDAKLKYLIRKGIPSAFRLRVWMETSEAASLMKKYGEAYYHEMLKAAHERSSVAAQIRLDVPTTFPDHEWLRTSDGRQSVENVLLAYSMHNPSVGYCPGMNCVVAMMLIFLEKREEYVFFLLIALIERVLYEGVYEPNLIGCQVEMKALGELLSNKLPKLERHLNSIDCDISQIASDWFLCMFCTSVPSEVCVRIWDCIFNEGPKILFRVAVAILSLTERQLLQIDNADEMLQAIQRFAANIHNRGRLMTMAFDGIGSLSKTTIIRLREQKRQEMDSLIANLAEHISRHEHQPTRWDGADYEDSVALDWSQRSTISTIASTFSVDWRELPERPTTQFNEP